MRLLLAFALAAAAFAHPSDTFKTSAGPVKITPVFHASVVVETERGVIYIDPWCNGDFSGLRQADLILITDIHADHMDRNCMKAGTEIWGPPAVVAQIPTVSPIQNGETKKWGAWTIQAVPMYNLKRGPAAGELFHDKGRGNGYVLTYGGKRFYFSGDTEGIPEMRALTNIDVAFVCMNLPYTMPPDEAADAVKAMHPAVVYPYHYRNGDGSLSDLAAFQKGLEGTGIEVRLRDWYAGAKK